MDTKQIVIDFIEGRMDYAEFDPLFHESDEMLDWIDSIAPEGKESYMVYFDENGDVKVDRLPFAIRITLDNLNQTYRRCSIRYINNLHSMLSNILKLSLPDIVLKPTPKYNDRVMLCLDFCPDYIGGKEVDNSRIIEKILAEIPEEWPKTKKIKYGKQRIKEEFHIDGRHVPYWIQPADWPVNNGKPMKFVKSVRINSEMKHHYFVDVDTGEERIVEDFH